MDRTDILASSPLAYFDRLRDPDDADPALAARMGAAGRRLLEERFTIPRLADEFLEEYELAIARRRAG